MSEPDTKPPEGNQLLEEAAAWFARMRGPEAESSRDEFEAWLARGALHRRAYNRVSEIFAMGKLLAEDGQPPSEERPSGPGYSRLVMATLALLLVAATASLLALHTFGGPAPNRLAPSEGDSGMFAEIVTGPSEARTVRLTDGSQLRLEPGTRVAVRLQESQRLLELERGEARFEVAHETRPFVVRAGGGQVTARGTVFDVGLGLDAQVTVRLVEGVVDVTLPNAGSARLHRRQLHPGETMRFAAQRESVVGTRSMQETKGSSLLLQDSAHDYDAILVADLVDAANRTASRPIRLADPQIGERRLSGRFRIDDTGVVAERIAGLFGLRVDRSDPDAIVLRSR